jgi:hypothetical protein
MDHRGKQQRHYFATVSGPSALCSWFPIAVGFLLFFVPVGVVRGQGAAGKKGTAPANVAAAGVSGDGSDAGAPLWSFAWVSDLHLDESRREFIARAFRYIDEEVKPRFLLITGDNNAIPSAPTDASRTEPIGVRRQRFFKAFLNRHLKTPYAVIPGDNWPEGFDQVFGARQFSFDYGGLHFLMIDPDRTFHGQGAEGLSVFDEPTWVWIRRDLDRHRQEPTIVVIHEPFVPCTFLDAPRLRHLVDRYPNVIAAFQGHLHVDLEFHSKQRAYFVAPSLGKSVPPAFKLVQVYPEVLIVRTIEHDRSAGRFAMTHRRQKIELPRPGLGTPIKPLATAFVMGNYSRVPPHPHVDDPALAARTMELWKAIGRTIGEDFLLQH